MGLTVFLHFIPRLSGFQYSSAELRVVALPAVLHVCLAVGGKGGFVLGSVSAEQMRRVTLALTPRVPAEGLPVGRPCSSKVGGPPGRRLGAVLQPPDSNLRALRLEMVLDRTLECLRESNTYICILLLCSKHFVL